MIQWFRKLNSTFGASFMWLVCVIYFTQGFRSFVWTAVSYLLKDRLKLSPSASQFVFSVAFFPWSVKPLYGILSDCIPIKGRKRIPYLIISTLLCLLTWLVLGLNAFLRTSKGPLTIFLTLQNLGSAMADVVIDAMIAEAVRSERASFSGDLQSMSWLAMAFGGVCGSLLGGYALMIFNTDKIFLLFSLLPTIQLLSCGLVEENPVGNKDFTEMKNEGSDISDEDPILIRKSENTTSRRRKNKKKGGENGLTKSQSNNFPVESLTAQWISSIKLATYGLCSTFTQPFIIRPIAWFFLAQVSVPNLSTVMFYYHTEFLNLDASFLGTARVVGWLGLMLGTFIYNHYLKNMKLRKILMRAHIGLAILSLLDIVLVSRRNALYGVSDKIMVICGTALADAVNQLKFMPFLILSGQLCPPGIEGTLFALFMSINNFGSTVGSFVGAGLASALNLSSGSFDNLLLGVAVQLGCTLIPIAFLFLIPKDATGVSA